MIIGIDLDGVTGVHDHSFRLFLAKKYLVQEENIMNEFPQPTDYKFSTWKLLGNNFIAEHTEAINDGIYLKMGMMDKASETLHKLNQDGYHNRIITSRFIANKQHYKVVSDTATWLDNNDIPYKDIMFVRTKGDVFADVYIEDSPENIRELRKLGKTVIVFDHLYNRDLGDELRAYNWDDIYTIITNIKAQ